MNNLTYGILWGLLGQVGSFIQLQGALKYGWYEKHFWTIIVISTPLSYFYMKSVEHFVKAFDGQIWPSRLLGFGIGIVTFTLLSWLMFKEPLTLKTVISIALGCLIISLQIFWK